MLTRRMRSRRLRAGSTTPGEVSAMRMMFWLHRPAAALSCSTARLGLVQCSGTPQRRSLIVPRIPSHTVLPRRWCLDHAQAQAVRSTIERAEQGVALLGRHKRQRGEFSDAVTNSGELARTSRTILGAWGATPGRVPYVRPVSLSNRNIDRYWRLWHIGSRSGYPRPMCGSTGLPPYPRQHRRSPHRRLRSPQRGSATCKSAPTDIRVAWLIRGLRPPRKPASPPPATRTPAADPIRSDTAQTAAALRVEHR